MRKSFCFKFFEEDDLYDENQINARIAEFEEKHGVKEERKLRKEAGQVLERYSRLQNYVVVTCTFS